MNNHSDLQLQTTVGALFTTFYLHCINSSSLFLPLQPSIYSHLSGSFIIWPEGHVSSNQLINKPNPWFSLKSFVLTLYILFLVLIE